MMIDYIKKNVLLDDIMALQPDASEYSSSEESGRNASVEDSAYWAARDMFDDVMTVIEGATPADVAPVVHGRWIEPTFEQIRTRVAGSCECICSLCGYVYADIDMRYCPYCGAKMDESEVKQ